MDINKTDIKENRRSPGIIWIFITVLAFFLFQQFTSRSSASISSLFDYSPIDPNGSFMPISVHHIFQAIITLAMIFVLGKLLPVDFGLKPGKVSLGLKFIGIVSIFMFLYMVISYVVGYSFDLVKPYGYPLDAKNISGTLAFQLLLSGPCEELLFRALPITILAFFTNKKTQRAVSVETVIAAALFSIAHINWSITSFGISFSYDIFQLIYAFALGIVQGVVFQKTGSVYYCMAIHSISNIFAVGGGYLIVLFIL